MPRPAAESAGIAPRKRPRTSASSVAPTAAPSLARAPPHHSESSKSSPAPPMSAVAARRAARLAAASDSVTPRVSLAGSAAPPLASDAERNDSPSGSESDASSTAAEEEQEQQKKAQPPRKQHVAQKSKGPTRYFAAPEPEVRLVRSAVKADAMEVESDVASPLDNVDVGSEAEPELPEATTFFRRRREKSAFVDPHCASAFHYLDGVNSVQTTVIDEDGVQRDAVVYALQHGESLVIRGACTLTPVVGTVGVLGATLFAPPLGEDGSVTLPTLSSAVSHPLFAPSSHPLPPIYGVSASTYVSRSLLLPSGIELDLTPFVAVVLVSDLITGVEGIERVLVAGGLGQGSGMFTRRAQAALPAQGGGTWSLVLEPEPSLAGLRPLEPWLSALASAVPSDKSAGLDEEDELAADRFVGLVEGPKRAGKSTFAKMLLNSLLARYTAVAYLDTDLGQPEFTPSGFLSLNLVYRPILGPSFTHISLPLASRFLGSTSPASDPALYLDAVQALLELYALEVEYPNDSAHSRSDRKVTERIPLVINTQGWVKGLGADLLYKLKILARPSHVFSFSSPEETLQPTFDAVTTWLPSAPPSPLESKWSAVDYRVLSLVAYFHALLAAPASRPSWDFTRPLLAQAPFALTLEDLPGGVRLVSVAGERVPYTHVLHALNGALVALTAAPSSATGTGSLSANSSALGLALVHSISPSSGEKTGPTLLVQTPVPAGVLANARAELALVKGELDLPVALMLDWAGSDGCEHGVAGVEWREVPFLSVCSSEAGGRRRVRRNVMRRGQT